MSFHVERVAAIGGHGGDENSRLELFGVGTRRGLAVACGGTVQLCKYPSERDVKPATASQNAQDQPQLSNCASEVMLQGTMRCVAYSPSSDILAAATADGLVTLISGATGKVLLAQRLGSKLANAMAFAQSPQSLLGFQAEEELTEDLFVVLEDQTILHLSNLRLAALEDAATSENGALLASVRSSVQRRLIPIESTAAWKGVCAISAARNPVTGDISVILGARDGTIAILGNGDAETRCQARSDRPLRKLTLLPGSCLLLSVHSDGSALLWDAIDLFLICKLADHVVDAAACGPGQVGLLSNDGALSVVPICPVSTGTPRKPTFTFAPEQSKLGATSAWSLVDSSPWTALPGFFAIGRLPDSGQPCAVRCGVKDPSVRFGSLLRARRYDEAFEAATSEADRASVHGARLRSMFTGEAEKIDVELAKSLLAKVATISPIQTVIPAAMKGAVRLRDPLQIREVLKHLLLMSKADKTCADHVSTCLFSLDTFEMLGEERPASFAAFYASDFQAMLRQHLAQGQLDVASVLMQRHSSTIASIGTHQILDCIPLDHSITAVAQWIRDQSNVLSQDAQGLAVWTLARAQAVAESGQVKLALQLLEKVLQHCLKGQQRALRTLEHELAELAYLADEHDLVITLHDFRRLSREEVLHMMLDRVMAPELIPPQVMAIRSCASRYGLHGDRVLLNYTDKGSLQPDAAREQCAVQLVRCISDLRIRSEAVLVLMRSGVQPPYSEELERLVQDSLTWATDIRGELTKQKRLMDLSAMVSRFRINKRLDFADTAQARMLLQYVLASPGHSTSQLLADALEIAKAYQHIDIADVYATALENLVITSELEDSRACDLVVEMLGAAPELAVARASDFCAFTLADLNETDDRLLLRAARIGSALFPALGSQWKSPVNQSLDQLHLGESRAERPRCDNWFKLIVDIHDICGQLVRPDQVLSAAARRKTLGELLDSASELSAPEMLGLCTLVTTQNRAQASAFLARRALSKGDVAAGAAWSKCIESTSSDLMVDITVHLASQSPALLGSTHEQLVKALVHAPPGLLGRATNLMRHSALISLVAGLSMRAGCDASHDSIWDTDAHLASAAQPTVLKTPIGYDEESPLTFWHASAGYVEPSGVLSAEKAIPLVRKFVFDIHSGRAPDSQLLEYLSENGALQPALSACAVSMCHGARQQEILSSLASKVLAGLRIDAPLALGYLVGMRDSDAAYSVFHATFPSVKTDFKRLQTLARVGIDLAHYSTSIAVERECSTMLTNAQWWAWLSELRVPFDHHDLVSDSAPTDFVQNKLMKPVIQGVVQIADQHEQAIAMKRVDAFATYYGVPLQVGHGLLLKLGLIHGQLELAAYAAHAMGPDPFRQQLLEYTWSRIPGTDYAALRLAATLLGSSAVQVLDLLQACEEFAFPHLPSSSSRPKRINLHQLRDPDRIWAEFDPFLSIETVKWLAALSDPLRIDPDEFHLRLVGKLLLANNASTDAMLQVLRSVTAPKRAIAACQAISDACRADSARISVFEFAIAHFRDDSGKVEQQLRALQTAQDLETIGTSTQELGHPPSAETLLEALYDSLAHIAGSEWTDPARLHMLAERIARRHGHDVTKIRRALVLRWLTADRNQAEAGIAGGVGGTASILELEVSRITYLLQPLLDGNIKRVVVQLLNFASADDTSAIARERALCVLFQVATEDDILAVYQKPLASLLEYKQHCAYLVDLEALRLPHSIDQLIKCDKLGLIHGLWRDFRHEPTIVRLLADLTVDFSVEDPKIVQAILTQLNHLAQHDLVLVYVDRLVLVGKVEASALKGPLINAVSNKVTLIGATSQQPELDCSFLETLRSILVKLPCVTIDEYRRLLLPLKISDRQQMLEAIIDKTKRAALSQEWSNVC